MDLLIRRAKFEDRSKIQQLINACATPYKSLDYLSWWNFSPLIPTVTFCAIHKGIFVGMFMVYKRTLNNQLKCGVLMGLGIIKSWRGKGLLKKLGQEALDYFKDLDLFLCLPNQNGRKALEKNLDFHTIGSVNTMILNIGNINCQSKPYICKQVTTETVFDEYNCLSKEIIMFRCNKEFRKWRFSNHPRYSYQSIRMDSREFLIVNIYKDEKTGIQYGDIVDFELDFFNTDKIKKLIDCAVSSLKNYVAQLTIQAIPNSKLYNIVKKNGFYDSGMSHNICMKVTNLKNDYLYDASNWLIKWCDYMR